MEVTLAMSATKPRGMTGKSRMGRKAVLYFGGFLSIISVPFFFTYVLPKYYPDLYSKPSILYDLILIAACYKHEIHAS